MPGFSAFLLTLLVLFPSSAFSDSVSVQGARHPDFGRIVFKWPTPVGYRLKIDGLRVTVRFDRPIEASYQQALGALTRYIGSAKPEADGKGVQFVLRQKFDAYGYDSGASVIVEIAETSATLKQPDGRVNKPAPAKSTTAKTADVTPGNLSSVGVRSGAHANYTRIVFDWPSKVNYTLSQSGGVVQMQFDKAANLQLRQIKADRPRLLGDIVSQVTSRGTAVALAVPPTSKVRHFTSGSKVVVDIAKPTGGDKPASLPKNVFSPAVPVQPKAASPPLTPVAAQPAEKAIKPATSTAPAPIKPSGTTAVAAPKTGARSAVAAAVAETSVVRVESLNDANLQEAAVSVQKTPGPVDGMDLRFDWKQPVAAAVFRRINKLWIVFDAKRRVDPDKILGVKPKPNEASPAADATTPRPPDLGKLVFSVDQLPATGGTVLRMSTADGVNPTLSRDGLSWILTFRKQPLEPKTPLEVQAEPNSPVGARLMITTPEPGQPIGVTDPDVGDNMVVVPLIPLSHGIVREYRYPEVRFPPTGQGILILSGTDNMRVRSLRQGVELTSSKSLNISSVTAEQAAGSKLGTIGPVSRLLDLERWSLQSPADFTKERDQLLHEIVTSKNKDLVQKGRWNLANFYFANGYAAEALGVLQQMSTDDPAYEKKAEFKLVRGASKYLMGRFAEAADDLSDAGLDKVDEGAFWRASVIAESGQVVAAAHELRRTGSIVQPYPKPLRFPLTLLVAESAVEIGDIENAQKYLESLKSSEPTNKQKADILYVEGKLAEIGGDEEGAVSDWEQAVAIDDRQSMVKAAYARANLLLQMQRMDPKQVIDVLERLRYLWRGDRFEFNLLRRLGTLYIQEKSYRKGLLALRQAATYYRNFDGATQITQQMSDTFNNLYLKNGADSMAPVTAIALYDEFRELTPAGRKGDEMIRKLADRLVKVDLLDQAAALLDNQVRFRLKGVEKAQVGTNLALIHAIAHEYQKVIDVLNETTMPDLPPDLAARRRHLRAHALIGLGDREQAVTLLRQDKSYEADLIRSEMYWSEGDWVNASRYLMNVVRGGGIKPGQALDDEQSVRILNLATAYTLSGNERALVRLRTDYGPQMESSRFKDAFNLVAAPLASGLINPSSVSSRVQTVTSFRSFLDKYKEQLKTTNLSSLTNVGSKLNEKEVPLVKG